MTLENLEYLNEEIVFREEKITELKAENVFNTGVIAEEKNVLGRFRVVKVGNKQTVLKVDDLVLINKNGLPKELSIEGIGTFKDIYVLPNDLRIACKINE